PVTIAHLVAIRSLHQNRILYQGVHRLAGGHMLELAQDRWTRRRFWAPRFQPPLEGTPDELAGQTLAALEDAVRRTTGPATSVGLLLSGGLDSSSISAVAVR